MTEPRDPGDDWGAHNDWERQQPPTGNPGAPPPSYGTPPTYGQQPPPGYPAPPPGAYLAPPQGGMPRTYLIPAIAVTVLFCLPAGIASIVFATQVSSKWNAGDHPGAIAASKKAKTWMIVSIVAGLLGWIFLAVANSGSSGY